MYFANFNKIYYDFEINGKRTIKIVSDITKNVRFRQELLSGITIYDEYDIKDGETPEIIAEKLYGSAKYHWIIMLVNERYDYIEDFPVSSYYLDKIVTQKYGVGHEYDTHHYVDVTGYIVDQWNPEATSVSNFQYEDDLNESKRRIKLISKSMVNDIVKNYNLI